MEENDKEEKKQEIIALIIILLILVAAFRVYENFKARDIEVREVSQKRELPELKQSRNIENFKIKSIKLININQDSKEELQKLPGVGEVLAERIISYRDVKGRFERKEDLTSVKGIGKKKYELLKHYITVR